MQNNRVTPIGAVPVELLSRILLQAVSATNPEASTSEAWKARVDLAAVCKTWRAIALGNPLFWTGVPLHPNCKQIDEMLVRWGSQPRNVHLDVVGNWESGEHDAEYEWDLDEVLDTELLNAARLREFHFSWKDYGVDDDLEPVADARITNGLLKFFQGANFPALRSLRIAFVDNFLWESTALPFSRLGDAASVLQHVVLDNCNIDWDGPKSEDQDAVPGGMRNLLTLQLLRVSPPPPSTVLSSILTSSPQLTLLHLDSLPEDFTPPEDWSAPNLQDVSLQGLHAPCGRMVLKILSMIPSPRMERLVATLESYSDTTNSHPDFTDNELISQWTNWLTQFDVWEPRGRQLHILLSRDLVIGVRSCPTTFMKRQSNSDHSGIFQLELRPTPSPASFMRETRLPLHIESLSFNIHKGYGDPPPVVEVRDFLGRHTSLTTLEVSCANAHEIIEFLDVHHRPDERAANYAHQEDNGTPSANSKPNLPNLRNLFFTNANFYERETPQYKSDVAEATDLVGVLRRREQASAAPLARLQFSDCVQVKCGDVKGLQAAFVEWGPRVMWESTLDWREHYMHTTGCDCKSRNRGD